MRNSTDVLDHCAVYLEMVYLGNNKHDNGEVTPVVLWDTLKAVIRGKLIAKTAAIKKLKRKFIKKGKGEAAQN